MKYYVCSTGCVELPLILRTGPDCGASDGSLGPIYSRYYPWCVRPTYVCEPEDLWDGWNVLHPLQSMDRFKPVLGLVKKHKAPNLLFIGDSNVSRLGCSIRKKTVSETIVNVLSNTKFVGVGGTKWWLLHKELHGIFRSKRKLSKNGNQWQQFFELDAQVDAIIIVNGSNDCDDFNNCIMFTTPGGADNSNFEDASNAKLEQWFSELKPIIFAQLEHITDLVPDTPIYYLPIIPRCWWNRQTRCLANKMDHYITSVITKTTSIEIKLLPNASLYKCPERTLRNIYQNTMPALFMTDNIHLNNWGIEAVLRDILPTIMDMIVNKLSGNRLSKKIKV